MAEIKIEKKKPVWPWILLGLIILGIILYFLLANDNEKVDDMDDTDTEQVGDTTFQTTQTGNRNTATFNRADTISDVSSQSVPRFVAHVEDKSRMGTDHEYSSRALTHLINAVEYKAQEQNVNLNADLVDIRKEAQEITTNPQATDHANKIKSAGTKIAQAIEKIQKEKFPNLEQDVEEVKTAAQGIDTKVQTLQQKEQINSFYAEAADVLQNMN